MAAITIMLPWVPFCFAANQSADTDSVTYGSVSIETDGTNHPGQFLIYNKEQVTPLYVAPEDFSTVRLVADTFAGDVQLVTGKRPKILEAASALHAKRFVIIGTIDHSPLLDRLRKEGRLDTSAIDNRWESAITTVVQHPFRNVESALVIAGSDRRGTAYAVFDLSSRIGVSPWTWWADVPVKHHEFIAVKQGIYLQKSPSVRYRGIFLNDEDWGLRPWASQKMDPGLQNIGPHTYERIFELLLRLHANTLWPAMHPGTLPFNAIPENAILADKWGIVMGSSHSEALLRNNVGEWNEKVDGRWNYQVNKAAIDRYWEERLKTNGKFENIYTVGMRGVHDSGLEATGSAEVKARLVESILSAQQQLLAKNVNPDVAKIPQVLWVYKEALGLYRAGMKVPGDVTLGWTDDNYGYIRQLPNHAEQARPGGSALYYHVSYWGEPHDYLWLCSTPPALMREELTKAWDHGVRQMWILNVGDLKPAEIDIDYFLRMAWNEPVTAQLSQHEFLVEWNKEQFPELYATAIANLMGSYYQLNFVRKPEFMGFNENDKPIERTAFNPLAWGDQNRQRLQAWERLSREAMTLGQHLPREYQNAYFELTGYPVEAAAAQNAKFLWCDRSYLDAAQRHKALAQRDAENAQVAYDAIQNLTQKYNRIAGGKWSGMMSSRPRDLRVFDMPLTAGKNPNSPALPKTWGASSTGGQHAGSGADFSEEHQTISIDAAHFNAEHNGKDGNWKVDPELGLPGGSVFFSAPESASEVDWVKSKTQQQRQAVATAPWIEYEFTNATDADATLSLHLLPTFPVDSDHRLRYAVIVDGKLPVILDAAGTEEGHPGVTSWASNVLRNSEIQTLDLGRMSPGKHTLRLVYGDPGVIFQHLVITFSGAPPAYPFPPETGVMR